MGGHSEDGAVKDEDALNMQKDSRGNRACYATGVKGGV